MKRRLSKEQIIGMIKEYEAGAKAQKPLRTSKIDPESGMYKLGPDRNKYD